MARSRTSINAELWARNRDRDAPFWANRATRRARGSTRFEVREMDRRIENGREVWMHPTKGRRSRALTLG